VTEEEYFGMTEEQKTHFHLAAISESERKIENSLKLSRFALGLGIAAVVVNVINVALRLSS
jgi:hypothetical protein